MPTLFDPLQLGDLSLPNRIIMAPLTRCRAEPGRIPGDLMVNYYRQRASAGLIISEATSVTPMGVGYPDTPGIWSDAQVEGWKKVTAAVHEAGGRIILQLWHVGRISDPLYLDGATPVAPSALQPAGTVSRLRPQKTYVTPRALDISEIPGVIEAYRQGAANARAAGFDGVEIHAANGYLIDQFLQSSTNRRNDAYGGSLENRARLLLEITDAILEVWAPGLVGVHLSPGATATTWATISRRKPSATSPRLWTGAASPFYACANMKARTAWRRQSAGNSPAGSLRTKPSTRLRPPPGWPRSAPTRSPSANCSSPIPTCPPASRTAPR